MRRVVTLSLVVCALGWACHNGSGQGESGWERITPLFGPIVSREVIGGRAGGGEIVWLLSGGEAIVRVDLRAHTAARASLAIPPGESCWGLAQLDDGSMWTLKGRRTLAQIGSQGRIVREIPLAEPHFGLYAHGRRLVFQPARFVAAGRLLLAGTPGDPHPEPWSALEPRAFPTLARVSVAALNMVACGQSRTGEQPCWFPDDTTVALIRSDGSTRRVSLDGLVRVPPEVLLTSENPTRPVRDVSIDEDGSIWVVSSGAAPPGASAGPGGWLLAKYSGSGALTRISRLSEPVRLILHAEPRRLLVLTGTGMVGEVVP